MTDNAGMSLRASSACTQVKTSSTRSFDRVIEFCFKNGQYSQMLNEEIN